MWLCGSHCRSKQHECYIRCVCNRCHVRYLKCLSIVAIRQQLNQIDIHVHVNDKFPFVEKMSKIFIPVFEIDNLDLNISKELLDVYST